MRGPLLIAALAAWTICSPARSSCVGTHAFATCTDERGNSYNVQRYGNTTQVHGSNPYTGSSWNQTSQTYGNTTYQNGTASNGNSWNQVIQTMPGVTTYSGSDSRGNSFYKTCTAYGCN